MLRGASTFIKNRSRTVAITGSRLDSIIWYVIECYQKVLQDSPQYSISKVKLSTTLTFEDFLKAQFVEEYLIKNKQILLAKSSELVNVNFHYENQKLYTDVVDGREKPDKIDIYINRLGLQDSWKDEDENIYFVIECKRIGQINDCKKYVEDTYKFANRIYKVLRLPFEGQLAFIENSSLDHTSISTKINKLLLASSTLTTNQYLQNSNFHNSFSGGYNSVHRRNHSNRGIFKVYHLLFDYSTLVTS